MGTADSLAAPMRRSSEVGAGSTLGRLRTVGSASLFQSDRTATQRHWTTISDFRYPHAERMRIQAVRQAAGD
jgi:hypothetical protein